jgi:hypothetical protein
MKAFPLSLMRYSYVAGDAQANDERSLAPLWKRRRILDPHFLSSTRGWPEPCGERFVG